MRHSRWLVGLLPLVLAGCMTLKPKFIPVGTEEEKASSARSPAEVQLVEALPSGFSYKETTEYDDYDEELFVEPGYRHRVLGYIKVDYPDVGLCDSGVRKKTVLQKLREAAFRHGANAVVDAHSNLGDSCGWTMFWNPCKYMGKRGGYGHGWAVVLEEPAAKP